MDLADIENADDRSRAIEMLSDLMLFEPTQRRVRPYDRFLEQSGDTLTAAERELANRIATAEFSLFHYLRPHEKSGLWIEDILDGGRMLHLVDDSLAKTLPLESIFGMRIFDVGGFYAGFGIVVMPDEDTVAMTVRSQHSGRRSPFRHSLAATMYADRLKDELGEPSDALAAMLELPPGRRRR